MCVYLRAKCEVSSMILTSFTQTGRGGEGGNFTPPPTSKRIPKKPTQIRIKQVDISEAIDIVNIEYR